MFQPVSELAYVLPPVSPPLLTEVPRVLDDAERDGGGARILPFAPLRQARSSIEAAVAEAERLVDTNEHEAALAVLAEAPSPSAFPELALRALLAESWARMSVGGVREAAELLERHMAFVEGPEFSDRDRAEVLYRLGCCRLKLGSVASAVTVLTLALELAERSGLPCDRLRAHVLEWRARCYQRQRDWQAARADLERALELAEALGDEHTAAHVYFLSSVVAERQGQWLLARCYAEQAGSLYERFGDRHNLGKVQNNLGGINFLLGRNEEAVASLQASLDAAAACGDDVLAGYATSSLAQIHLRTGDVQLAETDARRALELLAGREDHLGEAGNAQLVLGRALLEQDRLDEAEETFATASESLGALSSISHRAAAWMAQGDLAARRGDPEQAAALYRRAAQALQDFNF